MKAIKEDDPEVKEIPWWAAIALLPPIMAWRGFVFATMWGWFICPLGAAPIKTAHAAGIVSVVLFLRPKTDDKEPMTWGNALRSYTNTLLWLGLAYAINLCM